MKRRAVLGTLAGSASAVFSGCGNPDGKPWRKLSFEDVELVETDDGWRLTFEIEKQHQASDDQEAFHDVRVHGYADDRSEVCTKRVGTVSGRHPGGDGLPVEITCSEPPTMLTYSAAESPCDEEVETILDIAIYREKHGWSLDRYSRDCDEGLPPEPRG